MANEQMCGDSSCSASSCSGCSSASSCGSAGGGIQKEATLADTNIKHVIGVVSGKGGVGKSLTTALLASRMAREGYRVAILDADITGPSIPRVTGLVNARLTGDAEGIFPARTPEGIQVISTNLMLRDEETPIVWRGSMIAGCIKQFYGEVHWGDVDYMFVDMPPGTGDVPLTVFQSLPVEGIVIVTTPQELVGMIVGKAVNMAHSMDVPVLGIVENMSYLQCPHCNEKIFMFGETDIEGIAKRHNIDTYVRVPMDPVIAASCDAGKIAEVPGTEYDEIVETLKALEK